jgi:branched-chain amino acid transport system substrate-binding protein
MAALSACLVVAVLAAACSSGGHGGAAASAGSSQGNTPTGKPIEVMQLQGFANSGPADGTSGVMAAIAALNQAGGIHGRPVKLTTCYGSDLNATEACARQAAANPNIVAAVANTAFFGGFDAIAEQAGLPILGGIPVYTDDFKCSVCFNMGAGVLVVAGAAAILHDALHARHAALAYIDIPAGQSTGPLIDSGVLAPRGTKLAAEVAVPVTATDVAPLIASLPSDTDGVVLAVSQPLSAEIVTQARSAGAKYPIVTNTPTAGLAAINQLIGTAGTNLYVSSDFRLSGPGYTTYESEMKAIGKAGSLDDTAQAIYGYLSIQMLRSLATQLGSNLTRQALLAAAKATTDFSTDGLTPPLDFSKKQTALAGTLSAVVNPTVVAYKYDPSTKSLEPVNGGAFINIFQPVSS